MSEQTLKMTTYFGERTRARGRLLADELLDIHARHEIRWSVLLRGVQGFGAKHRLRTDRLLTLSEDLPLMSVAVDSRERIEAVLTEVSAIPTQGLVTLNPVRVVHPGQIEGASAELARAKTASGHWQRVGDALKLTIFLGRHERAEGSPAFVAVCGALHDCGVAGATVLLGVDGTRGGERRRARFFARNTGVPLVVTSVGDTQTIEEALMRIAQIVHEPLFTLQRIHVCKRDGALLAHPDAHPDAHPSLADRGSDPRQKLTIITSEASRHENRSVYIELVKRLRAAGAAGATSLRGIWGFHGEHAPHGDRLLAIRRHVPVVTIVIDTPDRVAALFSIVDELTRERGLVTSELLSGSSALHAAPAL